MDVDALPDDLKELLATVVAEQEKQREFQRGLFRAVLTQEFRYWQDIIKRNPRLTAKAPGEHDQNIIAAQTALGSVLHCFEDPIRAELQDQEESLVAQLVETFEENEEPDEDEN